MNWNFVSKKHLLLNIQVHHSFRFRFLQLCNYLRQFLLLSNPSKLNKGDKCISVTENCISIIENYELEFLLVKNIYYQPLQYNSFCFGFS